MKPIHYISFLFILVLGGFIGYHLAPDCSPSVINSPVSSAIIDIYKKKTESLQDSVLLLHTKLEAMENNIIILKDRLKEKRAATKETVLTNDPHTGEALFEEHIVTDDLLNELAEVVDACHSELTFKDSIIILKDSIIAEQEKINIASQIENIKQTEKVASKKGFIKGLLVSVGILAAILTANQFVK